MFQTSVCMVGIVMVQQLFKPVLGSVLSNPHTYVMQLVNSFVGFPIGMNASIFWILFSSLVYGVKYNINIESRGDYQIIFYSMIFSISKYFMYYILSINKYPDLLASLQLFIIWMCLYLAVYTICHK